MGNLLAPANLVNFNPTFQPVFSNVAAALITAQYVVPVGRLLILTNVQLEGIGGGAQTTDNMSLSIVNPPGTLGVSIAAILVAAANRVRMDRQVYMHIPEGWKVQGQVLFNAGAAANTAILNVIGLMLASSIPAV